MLFRRLHEDLETVGALGEATPCFQDCRRASPVRPVGTAFGGGSVACWSWQGGWEQGTIGGASRHLRQGIFEPAEDSRWLNFRLSQSPRRKMLELLELKCKRRGVRVFKVRAAGTSKYPSDLLVKRYRQDLKEHDWKGISLGSWSASLEKGSRVNRSGKVQSCGEFFTYKDPPLLVNADLNAAGNVALKAFHYHVRKKNLKASTPNIT